MKLLDKKISVRLSKKEKAALQKNCKQQKITISTYVRNLVIQDLEFRASKASQ